MADQKMMTFILANLIPLAIAAVTLSAAIAGSRFLPRLSITSSLLILHGAVVVGTALPSLVGKGGGEFPFDDIYFPFLLYPGVWLSWLNSRIAHVFWPWLDQHVGYHEGSYLCIVAIPAVLTTVVRGVFWMLTGRAAERAMKMRTANQVSQPIAASAAQVEH